MSEDNVDHFMKDLINVLLENIAYNDEFWKIALAVQVNTRSLTEALSSDNEAVAEFAEELLDEYIQTLMYARIEVYASEEEYVERQVEEFADLLEKLEEKREERHKEED